jgi:hypothetical protein
LLLLAGLLAGLTALLLLTGLLAALLRLTGLATLLLLAWPLIGILILLAHFDSPKLTRRCFAPPISMALITRQHGNSFHALPRGNRRACWEFLVASNATEDDHGTLSTALALGDSASNPASDLDFRRLELITARRSCRCGTAASAGA